MTLRREEAARLAFALRLFEMQFVPAERLDWQTELRTLVKTYAGTEEALLREVDLLENQVRESGRPGVPRQTEPLDRFIEAHQGTVAAAKALYVKGGIAMNSHEPKGADPTERLLQVIGIVEELESGRFPSCEWVSKAPSMVAWFFAYEPRFAPGNRERFVAAYLQFLKTHFSLDREQPARVGIGAILTTKIPQFLKTDGAGIPEVEHIFDTAERESSVPGEVRFLRANFYLMQMSESLPSIDRSGLYRKAQEALATVSRTGDGWIQRKALATLGTLQFAQRDYLQARSSLRNYLSSFPRNEWSWLAAIRMGDAEVALGNLAQAADAYRSAAERYVDVPLAVVLGHERAARALEALADFNGALVEYRSALAGWDRDYGETYRFYSVGWPLAGDVAPPPSLEVRRFVLEQRVKELTTAVGSEAEVMFERGRWLVLNGKRDEGIAVLRAVIAKHPKATAAVSARDTITRGRLEAALDLADVEKPASNEEAALKEFELLGREPAGFWRTAATIARGAILWRRRQFVDAEALAAEALNDLLALQKARIAAQDPSALEADVIAIRNFVFRPNGDGPFYGMHWEFKPDVRQKPFLVLRSHLNVKTRDGAEIEVGAFEMPPGFENALLLTSEELSFLTRLMTKIGGTKRREPQQIMDVPNQPAGPSIDVLAFLNRLFPAMPGHWGGWMFETFPMITRIEFLNADRTRAAVAFTIRYEGATLILEKIDGTWVMKSLTNRWIT